MKKLNILFLEAFYGGSHKDFADGLIKNSKHNLTLLTLPARFWKWRMRGAALFFVEQIKDISDYDLIFASDMMSISDLKMILGKDCPPIICYFHENQLSYPLAPGEIMDLQFGFTDITSCLASDLILFNSNYHLEKFYKELPGFIKKMPDKKPLWLIENIRKKSKVLYPGCNFDTKKIIKTKNMEPIILWNHRWEFDKNPEAFFKTLFKIKTENLKFKVLILGENFNKVPEIFPKAKEILKDNIIHYGWVNSKEDYLDYLKMADIVVSTSNQENFGISVIEAIKYGALPFLPNRLSYPELIPNNFNKDYIYNSDEDLYNKLKKHIINFPGNNEKLSSEMIKFSWEKHIINYDNFFESVVKN